MDGKNVKGYLDSITRAEYHRGDWEGGSGFSFTNALDTVLDLFDTLYKNLTPGVSRHAEIREIYAHLAGYDPDARMADCFELVQDICKFCSSPESVYPYPDGEKWTNEEIARFHRWQTVRNWRDEE